METESDLGKQGRSARRLETNTSQKRTKPPGNWWKPLLTWMWILIFVPKKSAQMHSWRTKLWKKNSKIRIQKPLKESKFVQIKFVFARIWRRRRWCLAKNPAKLFSRWVMWSSLSWRHPWIHAHHAYTTFLKGHFFAEAGSTSDPTSICCDESKMLLKSWRLHAVAHLRLLQGYKHGPNLWKEHHYKAKDALPVVGQKTKDGFPGSMSGQMLGRGACTTLQKLTSLLIAPHLQLLARMPRC